MRWTTVALQLDGKRPHGVGALGADHDATTLALEGLGIQDKDKGGKESKGYLKYDEKDRPVLPTHALQLDKILAHADCPPRLKGKQRQALLNPRTSADSGAERGKYGLDCFICHEVESAATEEGTSSPP